MLLAGTSSAWGAKDVTITSVKTGNWNDKTVWSSNSVPSGTNCDIVIPSPYTITIDGSWFANHELQISSLILEEGATLVIKGEVILVLVRSNNGKPSEGNAEAIIKGTVRFDGEYGGTIKTKTNNQNATGTITVTETATVSGTGDIEADVVNIAPGANVSGFTSKNNTVYLEGTNTVENAHSYSFAYKKDSSGNRIKGNQYVNYSTSNIVIVSGAIITFRNSNNLNMNNVTIQNNANASIDKAKGKFNGSGTLTITAELSVSNSGETNTFAPEATGTIFTSGTVRVTNPNWGGVAPRFYIGTNSNWTTDKNWSIDANRNIYYWNNNAYYYPGKNANNDVAHIAAGKSVTLSTNIAANPIGITAYGSVTLNGNISLGSSNKLIAYPGSNVTVNRTITRTNADQIIVYHTYANSASFYKGSTGSIGDNQLNVRHKIKGGRVYYMGASTEGGSYSMPAGTSESYDAATEEFTSGNPTSGTHRTGTVKLSAAGTISETGSVPFSDKTYTLKKAEGKFGWNLLCNPFTTGVSLSSLTAEDGAVEPTVWVRVKDGSSYGFVTYSISTGVSSPAGAGSEIAPQQAFFVKAKNDGVSFKVKYPSSGTSGATLKSATIAPDDVLRLTITSEGENADEVAMVFRNGGSLDRTYGDAEKRCENATYNALFALKDDVRCVIPFYPEAGTIEGEELPLGFRISSKSTKATITATNLDEFGVANDIYLIDKQENIITNLTEEMSYEFSAQAGIEIFERFAIVLGDAKDNEKENDNNDIATGIEAVEEEMQTALVYSTEGLIVNCTNTDNAVLRVYDSVGRLVICETISASRTVVQIANNGLYIAELTAPNGSTRTKILVK